MFFDIKEISKGMRIIRDYLVNIISGFLIIGNSYYAFGRNYLYDTYGEKILNVVDYVTKDIFKFIIFIFISYGIGFIVSHCVHLIPISKNRSIFTLQIRFKFIEMKTIYAVLYGEKNKHRAEEIETIESHIFGIRTLGSAFFINTFIFLVNFIRLQKLFDLILFLLFISLTIACEISHREGGKYLKLRYEYFLWEKKKMNKEKQLKMG